MYVCICRAITENQIKKAVSEGARYVRDINKSLGIPPQCGKCCTFMQKIVNNAIINLTPKSNTPTA